MLNKKTRSFTLMELVIAISLLSFVLLAIAAVDISSRKLLKKVDNDTALLMDVSPAMSHMEKMISLATGDKNHMGVTIVSQDRIEFNTDYNQNDVPNRTPEYTGDDTTKSYYLDNHTLMYDPDVNIAGNEQELTNKVSTLTFTAPFTTSPYDDFFVTINMNALYDPAQPTGPDNPEAQLDSRVCPRSHSIH